MVQRMARKRRLPRPLLRLSWPSLAACPETLQLPGQHDVTLQYRVRSKMAPQARAQPAAQHAQHGRHSCQQGLGVGAEPTQHLLPDRCSGAATVPAGSRAGLPPAALLWLVLLC